MCRKGVVLFVLTRRRKIILAFVIPGLLATGVVAGFLHFRLLGSAIEKWRPDNGYLIHTLKNRIIFDIDSSLRTLVATSRQPAFSSLPFLDQVEPSLNGIPENIDTEKRRILETLKADYGAFSVLFVLSPNGDHYISHPYSVQKKLGKFNLADRPYFIEASRSKKPVVSDSFTGADRIPAIAIDVPILNSRNDIVAHLGGVFHLSKLSGLVDAAVIRPFDAGFIVDRHGRLIAHTDTRLLQGGARDSFIDHPLVVNHASKGAESGTEPTEEFTDPDNGTEYLVASSRLENGWLLVLLRKKQSIIDEVYAQVAAVSFLVVLMLFGVGSVSALMIARMTRKWETAENDLRQTRDELEERVIARTGELESSERRFQDFANVAADWFWEQDAELRFTHITEENVAVTGVEHENHYGKTRQEIGFQDLDPKELAAYEERLQARKPFYDFRFSRMRPDGKEIYISVSGKPLFDGEGNFVGYRGAGREITGMVEAERTIRAERDRAEAANRAKSEFLASMSHELRTPLNAVLGFAQMLKIDPQGCLTQDQNEHLDSILTGGRHLLDLVNEILDLAKIESDQLDLSLEDVNAYEIVEECMALIRPLGQERGIEIIDRTGAEPWAYIHTDRMRLKQVLLNLLSNAIKFNKDGGTVILEGQEVEGGFLRISVTDNGIGIAEEDRASIFMMFQRLGADSMKAREGTGIGLTVAKHLVERMAGRIGLESREGVGSTFWLELPLVSNNDAVIWTEAMRIGVDALDKDHQVLIALLNQMSKGAVEDAAMDSAIDQMIDYTQRHFRREEAVMEVFGSLGLGDHRDVHRQLMAEIYEHAADWRKDKSPQALGRFRQFLHTWLLEHIMTEKSEILDAMTGKDQELRRVMGELDELCEAVSGETPSLVGSDLTVRMKSSGAV